ncbi:RagB/SusD family nutrient uptake outer membrane protein [Paludibacter jiangxiensis]|uniref:Starch-binding associating with outer membrane n=1 Tax=Paludibacter jiangxiensis TaxID=681398 RepID=A0A170YE77_9BACT|nr:RagB/SusD family nutrient uptake outer membrane protein [Paludibacter jiangxiensis]GAT61738.1 starch-binding associating with outer membrane [Paludibacter jiangxiensis]
MKTIIKKILPLALVAILFTGCAKDFLDVDQKGVRTIATFYKTDADATSAIASCYNMLRAMNASVWTSFWMTKESLADDIYCGGENSGDRPEYQELNTFTFGPTNSPITNIYRYSYMVIYRANLIIDNIKNPTPYQKLVIAEAKAMRAYVYFELGTLYGPVPLVLHELQPTEYAQGNSTMETLYAQIEKDLNEAIVDLPKKSQLTAAGSDPARFSKGTAMAFLGKAQLFEKKYAEAATTFQALIDSHEYDLYQLSEINNDYTQLFRKSTEFGKESIFEISYTSDRKNDWGNAFGDLWNDPSRTNPANLVWQLCGPRGDQGFSGGSLNINGGWGFGYPTLSLWNAFKAAGDSVRLQGTILTASRVVAAGGTMGKDGNYMYGCPGLVRLKYTTWADETSSASGAVPDLCYGTNLRIMRYADVLLMAAEAYLQSSKANLALPLINQVRTRVNLPALTSVTLDNIKLERRLELAFEGPRYQDLVRWGDAATVLKDQGKQVPTGKVVGGQLQFATKSNAGFVAPKNNMFPIPFNEMSSNPNVKQNPGY